MSWTDPGSRGDLSLLCQASRIKVGTQLWPEGDPCSRLVLNETVLVMTALERTGAGSSCRALMTVLTDLDLF